MQEDEMEALFDEMETIGNEALRLMEATPAHTNPYADEPVLAPPEARPGRTSRVSPAARRGITGARLAEAAVLAERLALLLKELAGDEGAAEGATGTVAEEAEKPEPEVPVGASGGEAKPDVPRMGVRLYEGARERLRARREAREEPGMGTRIVYDEDKEPPMAPPDNGLVSLVQRTSLEDPDPVAVMPVATEGEAGGGVRDRFGPDFDVDYDIS